MQTTKHYINLTNGLEALKQITEEKQNISFIRISSTVCEIKDWNKLLQDIDHDLYMNLAIGNKCIIYDYGARKPVSRALYQGVALLKYTLEYLWFDKINEKIIIKNHNCSNYYNNIVKNLDKRTLIKIKYYKKFLLTDNLDINIVSASTINDGNNEYYISCLKEWIENKL